MPFVDIPAVVLNAYGPGAVPVPSEPDMLSDGSDDTYLDLLWGSGAQASLRFDAASVPQLEGNEGSITDVELIATAYRIGGGEWTDPDLPGVTAAPTLNIRWAAISEPESFAGRDIVLSTTPAVVRDSGYPLFDARWFIQEHPSYGATLTPTLVAGPMHYNTTPPDGTVRVSELFFRVSFSSGGGWKVGGL